MRTATTYDFNIYNVTDDNELDDGEWLIVDDEMANQKAAEYIAESLWAFNSLWLADQTGLPKEVFIKLNELCEDANDAIQALIDKTCGFESFAEESISVDGRGHFLSFYDGEEYELGNGQWAYRIN